MNVTNDASINAISPAFERMQRSLYEAKMDEETVAFIMGRLTAKIAEDVLARIQEIQKKLGKEELQKLEALPSDEAREEALSQLILEKTGTSLAQIREEAAEKLVQAFEAA